MLSTKHGLLRPDDPVPGPYDVPISAALKDERLLHALAEQGRRIDFAQFRTVYLVEWDRFRPLVDAAVGGTAPVRLMTLMYEDPRGR
ncbi:MAG: hypothetical protein R2712_25355 [Vicinamibacterales bacterium]